MTPKSQFVAVFAAVLLMSIGCSRAPEQIPAAMKSSTDADGHGLSIVFKSDPNPPTSGDNTFMVTIKQAEGAPVADATVAVVFYMPAMPSMNMPEMRSSVTLAPQGNGNYRGTGQLVMSGTWNVTVDVARDGDKVASKKFSVIAK